MAEKCTSVNTSPEAAIVIKPFLPINAAAAVSTTSLIIQGDITGPHEEEAPFGTHLREAAALVKEWWKHG